MRPGGAPIDELLERVPSLAGAPRTVLELAGGLTNRNYKVTTPDGSFVARTWPAPAATCWPSTVTMNTPTPSSPRGPAWARR